MDIIVKKELTKLLKDATKKGCKIIEGIDMFANQAAYQFSYFLEKQLDLKKISNEIKESYLEL